MLARILKSRRELVAFVVLAMLVGLGVTPSAASVVRHHALAAVPALASPDQAATHYQRAIGILEGRLQPEGVTRASALAAALPGLLDGTRPGDDSQGLTVLAAADQLGQHLIAASSAVDEPTRTSALAALCDGSELVIEVALADAEAALAPAELEGVSSDSREAALRMIDQARSHHAAGTTAKGNSHTALNHFEKAWAKLGTVYTSLGISGQGDRDNDGLSNIVERILGSSPLADDTDGDGLSDHFEADNLLTYSLATSKDTDGDGVADGDEDLDGDGLTASAEQAAGTLPTEPDTDRDGLSDGFETGGATDPRKADTDGDTLEDGVEPRLGTSPVAADTDGDGVRDDAEVLTGVTEGPEGTRVAVTGTGDVASGVSITVAQGPRTTDVPGLVGSVFEFHADPAARAVMASARITLPLGSGVPTGDARVFTYDQQRGQWTPTGTDLEVAPDGRSVSVTVEHFSWYAIFDVANWGQVWTAATTCTPRTDPDGDPGDVVFVDLGLVLDSSGSMTTNDPDGLRRTASKSFVDSLLAQDRAAVVDFDSSARLTQPMTSDKAAVKTAIDRINDSGGTNIGAGVRVALDELDRVTTPGRARMIVLLTDGEGAYDPALTARAKADDVAIYTIGLGSGVNASLLRGIAEATGGQYFGVESAEQLPQVFRELSEQTGGDEGATKDTDEDGLTDCTEKAIHAADGRTYVSDPTKKDTDGDGVSDGDEVGAKEAPLAGIGGSGAIYPVHADPSKADTDADGLDDGNELDLGTQVWGTDTDGDGLGDGTEIDLGTDPFGGNTDGDEDGDAYEVAHAADGLSPIVYDEKVSTWTYVGKATQGFIFGDLWRDDSLPWLAGAVLSSLIPFVDIRDVLGSAIHGDWVGAGFSVAGLVPVVGDAVGVAGKVGKFVVSNPQLADEAAALVAKIDNLPLPARAASIKAAHAESWDALVRAGFSEDSLVRLAKGGKTIDDLADAMRHARHVPGAKGVFNNGWRAGEGWMESLYGVSTKGVDKQVWLSTSDYGLGRGRFIDVLPADGVAHETKTGHIRATDRIRTQIAKDKELVSRGDLAGAQWHFVASAKTDTIGADPEVFAWLDAAGIPFTIHVP